jgi:hypothetical protein
MIVARRPPGGEVGVENLMWSRRFLLMRSTSDFDVSLLSC